MDKATGKLVATKEESGNVDLSESETGSEEDSQNQVRYIDTKHQLADILTKGNFTRDEWHNLLHLFNTSHFNSTCCSKDSSLMSCTKTMAQRMQEQKGEERSVAKSKSTAMNLSSHVPTSSSSAKSPIASKGPGILIATGNLKAG